MWSKRNRLHAERLIEHGRMQKSGFMQVARAKQNGEWADAYIASEMEVQDDSRNRCEARQISRYSNVCAVGTTMGRTQSYRNDLRGALETEK